MISATDTTNCNRIWRFKFCCAELMWYMRSCTTVIPDPGQPAMTLRCLFMRVLGVQKVPTMTAGPFSCLRSVASPGNLAKGRSGRSRATGEEHHRAEGALR